MDKSQNIAKIAPSMMCADIGELKKMLEIFESSGIDYLHIDIMDGIFVPNFTLGTDYCKKLRTLTKIPLDIHLMIEKPEDKIAWFEPQPNEYVSVHFESTPHIRRALDRIKATGAKPMLALNPATPLCCLDEVCDIIDAVLIMTVNPGYAGQRALPSAISKIARAREYLDRQGFGNIKIEVDGNVSFENVGKMYEFGADIFVAGSSSVFSTENTLAQNIERFRCATEP